MWRAQELFRVGGPSRRRYSNLLKDRVDAVPARQLQRPALRLHALQPQVMLVLEGSGRQNDVDVRRVAEPPDQVQQDAQSLRLQVQMRCQRIELIDQEAGRPTAGHPQEKVRWQHVETKAATKIVLRLDLGIQEISFDGEHRHASFLELERQSGEDGILARARRPKKHGG